MLDDPSKIETVLSNRDYILIYGTLISVVALSLFYVVLQNFFLSRKIISQLQVRIKEKIDSDFDSDRYKILNSLPKASNIGDDHFIKAILSEYGVSITNLSGTINFANKKLCEISGYSEFELIGRTHKIFNSRFHSEDFWKNMWDTILSGKVWNGEVMNIKKNGEIFWVSTIIFPLQMLTGNTGFLTLKTDITALKNREQGLLSETEKLEGDLIRYTHQLESKANEQSLINNILIKSFADFSSLDKLLISIIEELSHITWMSKDNSVSIYLTSEHGIFHHKAVFYSTEYAKDILQDYVDFSPKDLEGFANNPDLEHPSPV